MNYLRFDRLLMTNLEKSLDKEMLRTNRAGAYSSGTIVDCNTRKYHGLLVVPVENLGGNHVLLSSCDETLIQHGAEFNIGLHKYAAGTVLCFAAKSANVETIAYGCRFRPLFPDCEMFP